MQKFGHMNQYFKTLLICSCIHFAVLCCSLISYFDLDFHEIRVNLTLELSLNTKTLHKTDTISEIKSI